MTWREFLTTFEAGKIAAALVGIIVGIGLKYAADFGSDRRRRKDERRLRLHDAARIQAVDFLIAADRVRRGSQAVTLAYMGLDGAKGGDQAVYEEYREPAAPSETKPMPR